MARPAPQRTPHTTPVAALLGCALLLAAAQPARAGGSLRLQTSSYLRGFSRPGIDEPSTHIPFYELVQLYAQDLGTPGLSVQASLWGRVDIADLMPPDDRATGDVNLLFVRYLAPVKSRLEGLELRLGRQFVSVGPSVMEQLDGASADYRVPGTGLRLTAFGGMPTGVRFVRQLWAVEDDDRNYGSNWVVGGRVGYDYKGYVNVGGSYRHKRLYGRVAHEEAGWDLTVTPLTRLQLLGDGVMDLTTGRLKEAQGAARVELTRKLDLSAGYRFRSPDLYIPRSSIFAVFSNEQHQNVYGELYWVPWRRLSLTLELGGLFYGESCVQGVLGGTSCDDDQAELSADFRADLRLGERRQYRLTFEADRQGAPEGGMTRFRLAATGRVLPGLTAVVDVETYLLDDAEATENMDSRLSVAGSAHLAYAFRPDLALLAGGQVMTTPLYESTGAFMVRMNWLLDAPTAAPGGAKAAALPAVRVTRNQLTSSALARSSLGGGAL